MRPIISLLIAVLLAAALTACGQEKPTPAEAVPAPDPAPIEQVREDPFSAYFDLSGLTPETLEQARQVIDQESVQDGITVHVSQTLGDGRSLYVAFTVTSSDAIDPAEPLTVRLVKGGDPTQTEELPGRINSGINGTLTGESTMSYLAEFEFQDPCLTGQAVSLLVEGPSMKSIHTFTWTVENEGFFVQADLVDQAGHTVGSAALSPFLLTLELPAWNEKPQEEWTAFEESLHLLDADGKELHSSQHLMGLQVGDGARFAQFYAPIAPDTAATIQAEGYTGTFQ